MENLIVVVSCYKGDFFLTKICVASIKYYHPEAEVYLLKDSLAGYFDSSELEKAFQVQVLDLGIDKYGWGAAKVHFILSNKFKNQRVFILDSDIVFVGRFLRELFDNTKGMDFVVNPDYYQTPYEGTVPLHYYRFDNIKKFDPAFSFIGYVFNTGHLIVTPNKLTASDAESLFDIEMLPYYKRLDILPQVDQSLFNYLLPKMSQQELLTLKEVPFMIWSDGPEAKALVLREVQEGNTYPFLIHWAGVTRIPNLDKMTRSDILHFFQDYYYSKVPLGNLKKLLHMAQARADYHLRGWYRSVIKSIPRKS